MNCDYLRHLPVYKKMRDTMNSEEHMKNVTLAQNSSVISCVVNSRQGKLSATSTFGQYLRPSDGMRRSEHGYQRFCDYIYRAKFYPYPIETHDQALGMIQNEPPEIELPPALEFMRYNATANYESLEKVMSIVNSEQMVTSRIGLLASPVGGITSEPFNFWFYKAESIVNWNEKLVESGEKDVDWLVLKTNEKTICAYENKEKPVYQVLYMEQDVIYSTYKTTNEECEYGVYVVNDKGYVEGSYTQPFVRERKLNKIPFVLINAQRLGYEFEQPFLEPISDAAIKVFQASARHEDNLEHGGKNTMFTKGYATKKGEQIFQGNGAVNKTGDTSALAWMVTAGVDGIEPSRKDLEEKKADCVDLGVDLVNQGVESGIALSVRTDIKTASLKTLAKTGAEGLERLLKICAEWIGANPEEVSVTANTSFADPVYTADDLVKLSLLVRNGDMSKEAFFNILKKMGLTVADLIGDEDLQKEIELQEGVSL